VNILKAFGLQNSKSLFILPDYDKNILMSSRNLTESKVLAANDINAYELLWASTLLISEDSVTKIKESHTA
jgi:large subunit ribosomal protein L4